MQNIQLKNLVQNFIVLLSSIIIFLLLFELFLRIAFPENEFIKLYCYDPLYGWNFCKDAKARIGERGDDFNHVVNINSKGMRDFEGLNNTKKNIVVLGDSFTSNIGIKEPNEVYTEVLEKNFFKNYNVINLGVDGFGTAQEYLKLKHEGLSYYPEIVILTLYLGNDLYDNVGIFDWITGYKRPFFKLENNSLELTNVPVPKKEQTNSLLVKLLKKLRMATFVHSKIQTNTYFKKLISVFGIKYPLLDEKEEETIERYYLTKINDLKDSQISYSYNLTCRILSKINSELKEKNIRFYLVIVSTIYQIRDDYFNRVGTEFNITEKERFLSNNELIKCTKRNNISYIDLTKGLSEENNYNSPYYFYQKNIHWTKEGNRRVAEIIGHAILNNADLPKIYSEN